MLVTGKEILDHANKNGYAVGAFNVVNMEMLQAVVTAAEEEESAGFCTDDRGRAGLRGV